MHKIVDYCGGNTNSILMVDIECQKYDIWMDKGCQCI